VRTTKVTFHTTPHQRPESNRAPSFWRRRCALRSLAFAPRRGIEPLSFGRQPSCDASRITRHEPPRRESNAVRAPQVSTTSGQEPRTCRQESAARFRRDGERWGGRRESDPPCEGHNLAPSPDGNDHHSQGGWNRTSSTPARTERAACTPHPGAPTSDRTTFSRASTARYDHTSSRCVAS
jgi:hypothetical protein